MLKSNYIVKSYQSENCYYKKVQSLITLSPLKTQLLNEIFLLFPTLLLILFKKCFSYIVEIVLTYSTKKIELAH